MADLPAQLNIRGHYDHLEPLFELPQACFEDPEPDLVCLLPGERFWPVEPVASIMSLSSSDGKRRRVACVSLKPRINLSEVIDLVSDDDEHSAVVPHGLLVDLTDDSNHYADDLLSADLSAGHFNVVGERFQFYPSLTKDLHVIPFDDCNDDVDLVAPEDPLNLYCHFMHKARDAQELLVERNLPPNHGDIQKTRNILCSDMAADTIIIAKFNVNMTCAKIRCLRPGQWLNDEAVNFYMCMLQERDVVKCRLDPHRRPSHFFNTFFRAKLRENNIFSFDQVKRWSKKFDVFAMDKIFVPINISNMHWVLAVIFVQKRVIRYYDALNARSAHNSCRFHSKDLKMWLEMEHRDKKGVDLPERAAWKAINIIRNIPLQTNGYDCGLFVLRFADLLSDDIPLKDSFSQKDMFAFREMVALFIMNGMLSYKLYL